MSSSVKWPQLIRTALLLIVCLMVPACAKSKLTQTNFDKVQNGMTLKEVEAVLGEGTKDEGDGSGVAAQFGVYVPPAGGSKAIETYTWSSGNKTITIQFNTGKVGSKQSSGL